MPYNSRHGVDCKLPAAEKEKLLGLLTSTITPVTEPTTRFTTRSYNMNQWSQSSNCKRGGHRETWRTRYTRYKTFPIFIELAGGDYSEFDQLVCGV